MKLIVTVEIDGTEDQQEEVLDQIEELIEEHTLLEVAPGCTVEALSVSEAPASGRRRKGD